MAGRATLTTVLSMKARLEPRMVAASIQALASAPHGTPAAADRITVSSQGVFTEAMIRPGSSDTPEWLSRPEGRARGLGWLEERERRKRSKGRTIETEASLLPRR